MESYRTLFAILPDNLDYGLRLTHVETAAANAHDAQATLDALRRLPAPVQEDPRIDLAAVRIEYMLGDYKRAPAAASWWAASKGEAQGARLLLAKRGRS